MGKYAVSIDDIRAAAGRIKGVGHRTPILTSQTLDKMAGRKLFFKCENFQKVGAFKLRGGWNAVSMLSDEEAAKGVCTHSSGNHAQALAFSAMKRGIASYIVMPNNVPDVKLDAVSFTPPPPPISLTIITPLNHILNTTNLSPPNHTYLTQPPTHPTSQLHNNPHTHKHIHPYPTITR